MTYSASIPTAPRKAAQLPCTIAAIATHVPERVLTNDELAALFPDWPAQKIFDKTGIRERRIAAPDETASDLAFAAAEKLFAAEPGLREEVDFLIFCTQAADYILPTTACLLQDRLRLGTHVGAIDVNLGCSGFVYCLSLAAAVIAAGTAGTVLVLTADTYSKYINERDKSVRTLFGDGAAATVVRAAPEQSSARIGPFIFGTDGSGGRDLMVPSGGFRTPRCAETAIEKEDRSGNIRSPDNLYMDGGRVMSFTLKEVPRTYERLLQATGWTSDDVDHVVLHQANAFMLDALQRKLALPDDKFPRYFEEIGNTVSSTIPFVLAKMLEDGQMAPGTRIMLIGFGVGLSWAGASIQI
jgi:3-oxoacyl-[acyl-carrier-protein] synthase-3